MKIKELVEMFKNNKVQNTKIAPNAIGDFLTKNINITSYISFQTKREIAQTIIDKNITVKNGYKVVNSYSQFLSFIISMLISHTDLIVEDPYADYDLLCEAGLLQPIIELFQQDYSECETVLKMLVNDELQTNVTPAIIAEFLDKISNGLGGFSDVLKDKLNELNIDKLLNDENIDLLKGVINK